jgi:hypothetical protein
MELWSNGVREFWSIGNKNRLNLRRVKMVEYTKFRNKNRGYMKLEAWQKAMELFKFKQIDTLHYETENKLINLIASLEVKRDTVLD